MLRFFQCRDYFKCVNFITFWLILFSSRLFTETTLYNFIFINHVITIPLEVNKIIIQLLIRSMWTHENWFCCMWGVVFKQHDGFDSCVYFHLIPDPYDTVTAFVRQSLYYWKIRNFLVCIVTVVEWRVFDTNLNKTTEAPVFKCCDSFHIYIETFGIIYNLSMSQTAKYNKWQLWSDLNDL